MKINDIASYVHFSGGRERLISRTLQIVLEICVLEWHVGRSEIRVLQCSPRHSWHRLPCHQWLLSSNSIRQSALVVHRPAVIILDQRRRSGLFERVFIGRAVPSAVGRWTYGEDVIGRSRGRVGDPDDNALPVVAVAQILRGVVLREIPGVHQGIGVRVGCVRLAAADIDLASATAAVTV